MVRHQELPNFYKGLVIGMLIVGAIEIIPFLGMFVGWPAWIIGGLLIWQGIKERMGKLPWEIGLLALTTVGMFPLIGSFTGGAAVVISILILLRKI